MTPKPVERLLNELRRTWVGDNPVIINGVPSQGPQAAPAAGTAATEKKPATDRGASLDRPVGRVCGRIVGRLEVAPAVLTRPEGADESQVPVQFIGEEASPPSPEVIESEEVEQAAPSEPTPALQRDLPAMCKRRRRPRQPRRRIHARGRKPPRQRELRQPTETPPTAESRSMKLAADSSPSVEAAADVQSEHSGPAPHCRRTSAKSPINVTVTPDGQIIVSSPDGEALDRMEDLIHRLSPPQPRFKVFPIKHVAAQSVWTNLTEYYAGRNQRRQRTTPAWIQALQPKKPGGLSARQELKIMYDQPTNSVVVSNASASQLGEIESTDHRVRSADLGGIGQQSPHGGHSAEEFDGQRRGHGRERRLPRTPEQ